MSGSTSWPTNSASASPRCARHSSSCAPRGCSTSSPAAGSWCCRSPTRHHRRLRRPGPHRRRAGQPGPPQHITDDQLQELNTDPGAIWKWPIAADDAEAAVRLNHEFHRAINVAADSPKLAQLMSQITRYAPESVFPTIDGWPDQSNDHHRRLLDALATPRRGPRAQRCRNISAPRGAADRPSDPTRCHQ